MKLTPFQLAALVVGGFASIVMLNVLAKYQSNEDFRKQLGDMKPTDLLSFRKKIVDAENMVTATVPSDDGGGYESNDEQEEDDGLGS